MNTRFFSHIRTGLVALGVLAGLSVPAAATPLAGASRAAVAPDSQTWRRRRQQVSYHRCRCYDRYRWRQIRPQPVSYNYWNDDWRYRRHYRPVSPSRIRDFIFGLGVPGFQYYAPQYRYYAQPRRYYRGGGTSAHVAWCYNRYRSYRQWDNTFQPYYGGRRQCWSPYS